MCPTAHAYVDYVRLQQDWNNSGDNFKRYGQQRPALPSLLHSVAMTVTYRQSTSMLLINRWRFASRFGPRGARAAAEPAAPGGKVRGTTAGTGAAARTPRSARQLAPRGGIPFSPLHHSMQGQIVSP